jgi:hypothetical protein
MKILLLLNLIFFYSCIGLQSSIRANKYLDYKAEKNDRTFCSKMVLNEISTNSRKDHKVRENILYYSGWTFDVVTAGSVGYYVHPITSIIYIFAGTFYLLMERIPIYSLKNISECGDISNLDSEPLEYFYLYQYYISENHDRCNLNESNKKNLLDEIIFRRNLSLASIDKSIKTKEIIFQNRLVDDKHCLFSVRIVDFHK